MRYVALIAFVVCFGLCGTVVYLSRQVSARQAASDFVVEQLDRPASTDGQARTVQFVVKPGDSAAAIADHLQQVGVISDAWSFGMIARLKGEDGHLAAGEYQLRASMRPTEIIDAINSGQQRGFTVVEGWRIAEIADALQSRGLAQRDEFVAAAQVGDAPPGFLSGLPPDTSLEGYLFPDTYQFLPGTSSRDLIRAMLDDFDRRVTPEMRQQAADRKLSIGQMVTLASIVEREAVVASERPCIAGVFYNRMSIGMPLQTDPTIQFAILGPRPPFHADGYWKRDLSATDLSVDSPYNTYNQKGLPPGPIANPGLASIQAVLQPEQNAYLYFVAKPDGSHAFATTLDEHNQNVARYQQGR